MRTTLDIPDHIFRQTKALAASRGMKLKDLVALFMEKGLAEETAQFAPRIERSPPIMVREPSPLPIKALTNSELYGFLEGEPDVES